MTKKEILEKHNLYSRDLQPPNLLVSEWANRVRKIRPPGWKVYEFFDFDKTPYLRRPCDLASKNSSCKYITVVKGSRLGFSQGFILNSAFYNMDVNPCQMYYVSADQKLLDKFTRTIFMPALRESGLDSKIMPSSVNAKNKNKRSGETSELLEFGNGDYLIFSGANNPNNFRQLGAQYVYLDERAAYPVFRDEGDAGDLAIGRTGDYSRYAKIIQVSTPKMSGSKFERDYKAGTMEQYYVICPACGKHQVFTFGKLDSEKKLIYGLSFKHENYQLKTQVKYKCCGCGREIPEEEKYNMLIKGYWKSNNKNYVNDDNVSLQISSLYSNFETWESVAEAFLKAKREGKPSDLQTFKNLYLGEFFELKTKEIKIEGLMKIGKDSGYCRSETNGDIAFLTAAADVQTGKRGRIEIEIKGWGKNKENWSIDYFTFQGNPEKYQVWDELENFILTRKWGGLYPSIYYVDEGDGNVTDIVRNFCKRVNSQQKATVILPLKGASPSQVSMKKYNLVTPKILKVKTGIRKDQLETDLKLLRINTYHYKEQIFTWLDTEEKDGDFGICHFPQDYPKKYYEQLNSEKMAIDIDKNGYEKVVWKKTKTRNEALDLFCYNACIADYFIESLYGPLFLKAKLPTDWDYICSHMIKKRKKDLTNSKEKVIIFD